MREKRRRYAGQIHRITAADGRAAEQAQTKIDGEAELVGRKGRILRGHGAEIIWMRETKFRANAEP